MASVALRKESVDRNQLSRCALDQIPIVALRKESVDRNWQDIDERETISVALRKESVDRNRIYPLPRSGTVKSLSARRAWIEIDHAV